MISSYYLFVHLNILSFKCPYYFMATFSSCGSLNFIITFIFLLLHWLFVCAKEVKMKERSGFFVVVAFLLVVRILHQIKTRESYRNRFYHGISSSVIFFFHLIFSVNFSLGFLYGC